MKETKISFLIPAHNEEKIIEKTLINLENLPYSNYEVLLGLDGCVDGTEEIVKSFCKRNKNFKYYKLNLRQGKPAVINSIIKKATGDIIIINDADWVFNVKNNKTLNLFLSVFKGKRVGGIAESLPVEWDEEKIKKGNFGYKMVAYSSYFWFEYQKKMFTYKKINLVYLKKPKMFLTNIFRRKLYRENVTLGDDFERSASIMNDGYEIVSFDKLEMPRMIAVYDYVSIPSLFNQKVRTGMARSQVNEIVKDKVGFFDYYLPSVIYILINSWKKGIVSGIAVLSWVVLTSFADIISRFREKNTKKGWKLRLR